MQQSPETPKESFGLQDLDNAVTMLATMRFFPSDAAPAVKALLADMCPHREALEWLTAELVNHVPEWPGLSEVRGLLCARYDPADGIDAWCMKLVGYRAEDFEARTLAEHEQRKIQERVGGYVAEESQELLRQLTDGKKQKKPLLEAVTNG